MEYDSPLVAGDMPSEDQQVRDLINAGQLADANRLFDEVVSRVSPGSDRWSRAAVLVNRAVLAWRLNRIPLALELAAEGWTDLDAEDPDSPAAAQTMSALGYLLEGIGHRRAALDMLRLAVQVARRSGSAETLAQCLQRLGGTLNFRAAAGPPQAAEQTFREAARNLREGLELVVDPPFRRAIMAAYSRSLAGIGELDRAEQLAQQTHDLCVEAGDEWGQSVADWVLGILHRHRGDLDRARADMSRSVELAERVNDISLLLRFSLDLADTCAAVADPVGEADALRHSLNASLTAVETLQEGLGQALEQRKVAVQAQRMAVAAQEAAARDPLTGLTNRFGLERTAPFLLDSTAAKGRIPWLVLLDVDWFKGVNDDAGHAAGDAVLREIAQLLRRECRADDLVARWAGDEFVVLLGDTGNDYGIGPAVAERIRKAVDQHDWAAMLGPLIRQPTVSVGVAAGPADLNTLFSAADDALYRAKRLGRNRVEVAPAIKK